MRINDITRQSLLFDFYGALLTERQREALELYHEENLTLAEIAAEFGISRQGVHDALKNGEKSLEEYEKKLGLIEKFSKTSAAIEEIDRRLECVINKASDSDVIDEIREVKAIIDNLED